METSAELREGDKREDEEEGDSQRLIHAQSPFCLISAGVCGSWLKAVEGIRVYIFFCVCLMTLQHLNQILFFEVI